MSGIVWPKKRKGPIAFPGRNPSLIAQFISAFKGHFHKFMAGTFSAGYK
jgi:hypothetical protein